VLREFLDAPSSRFRGPNRLLTKRSWNYLQAGITRIMNDLEQGIDMQMYMGVYTYVQAPLDLRLSCCRVTDDSIQQ